MSSDIYCCILGLINIVFLNSPRNSGNVLPLMYRAVFDYYCFVATYMDQFSYLLKNWFILFWLNATCAKLKINKYIVSN